jgi:hypothetical protein
MSAGVWIVVTGGRDYIDYARVAATLDGIHSRQGIVAVVHGDARGADTLAARWANGTGIPCLEVPARWSAIGLGAGTDRNARMLNLASLCARGTGHAVQVVAFPGARGTRDCVNQATKRGLPVMEVSDG